MKYFLQYFNLSMKKIFSMLLIITDYWIFLTLGARVDISPTEPKAEKSSRGWKVNTSNNVNACTETVVEFTETY